MPKLDQRLIAVTRRIRSRVHADVGSDHGLLLKSLLASGRISRGIAIENKQQPFRNSSITLAGMSAEVRLGDGLQPLAEGEVDSLSICGMGAENIVEILERFPDRIPDAIVLQPNSKAERIRRWAWEQNFWLLDEQVVRTTGDYAILSFGRPALPGGGTKDTHDPAYDGVDLELGIALGPLLLKRSSPEFVNSLKEEAAWWHQFPQLGERGTQRLEVLRRVLDS